MASSTLHISLGTRCIAGRRMVDAGVREFSCPYDWLISNPKFVNETLTDLMINNHEPERIVTNKFLPIDYIKLGIAVKKVPDVYRTDDGTIHKDEHVVSLINTLYRVALPHEVGSHHQFTENHKIIKDTKYLKGCVGQYYQQAVAKKYIRRFTHLKTQLLSNRPVVGMIQTIFEKETLDGEPYWKLLCEDSYDCFISMLDILKKCHKDSRLIMFGPHALDICKHIAGKTSYSQDTYHLDNNIYIQLS